MPREKPRERNQKPPTPEPAPDDVRYGAAVAEIEQILASIDRDEIDLDELSQKVERAVELLKICRARLKATELRVTQVLKDVAAEAAADESGVEEADKEKDEEDEPDDADEAEAGKKKKASPDPDDEELPF